MTVMSSGFKPLKRGDTLGIIAPSSPSERERIDKGVSYLRSKGFKTKIALDPSRQYGKKDFLFSSDSIAARVKALHDLFADDSVATIITTRGGYGSVELLPYLDWKLFRKNPKPLVGFSDTTALLTMLYQKSGLTAVHGPTVESLSRIGENPEGEGNADSLFSLLANRHFKIKAGFKPKFITKERYGRGPLLVGNLSVLSSLMGTPFEPEFARHIICFEDSGEKPFRIHRMLLQMKLAGKFKRAAGVLLGSFNDCAHPQGLGPTADEVFNDIFADSSFAVAHYPIFGHDKMNRALPVGRTARLDLNGLQLR